jgi:Baculoviridae late expression factor 5/Baculoviridae late expression factor 5 C-terminal domain
MSETDCEEISAFDKHQKMTSQQHVPFLQKGPRHDVYRLYLIFKEFRETEAYDNLILFLIENFPENVKNKTFNFMNTQHLFHSLYAYIPAITNAYRERKQIRLSPECIHKLFLNTINDFKLYGELFQLIQSDNLDEICPCELLFRRRDQIKEYVQVINEKKFDKKPPKLKKESIDNIMYKYSLNWKNIMLKKKISSKKKRKMKKRNILNDDIIYFNIDNTINKLPALNGLSLIACVHQIVTVERQLRAGDETVSFLKICQRCNKTF